MAEKRVKGGTKQPLVRKTPTSDEVRAAAYDTEATLKLIRDYQLTAVDLAQLLERIPDKLVPW